MKNGFDFLVVGAGITGLTIARLLAEAGKKVCVVDKRQTIGGNCYTEEQNGIHVHKYGAHIFRTSSEEVKNFVERFAKWMPFQHKVVANVDGELYSFPINLMTINKLHPDVKTPRDVMDYMKENCIHNENPKNLEEKAISIVGEELYNLFIKGYTEKQWGKKCTELPEDIINRIPVRCVADDNYFTSDKIYQMMPVNGYTEMFVNMANHDNITLILGFEADFANFSYKQCIYTGAIDEYFDYKHGKLEWRSLKFKTEKRMVALSQCAPVVNYCSRNVPYTRIIEHKQFNPDKTCGYFKPTFITYEYPDNWELGKERYYPIRTTHNLEILEKYHKEADKIQDKVIFAGRLGHYKYYDMDVAIEKAIEIAKSIIDEL